MDELKIEYVDPAKLKPYERNARKHQQQDLHAIEASIQAFGFKDPIGVWGKEMLIVEGHGRQLAALELGLKKVPIIRLDDLTDDQRRAYALAHNKTAELSEWDYDLLNLEIQEVYDIDMEEFGFDLYDPDEEHEEYQKETQERVAGILNLDKGDFAGAGYYDIPQIEPVYELPPIKEWIGFNYVLTDQEPEGKGVHFYIDDYQFERIWKEPDKYVEKLKRYVCVASPDFSPYGEMPVALQIYNHYRKHWVAQYLQKNGVTVVPTIRGSSNPKSLDWFLDGEPRGGIVLVSTMWADKDETDASEHDKRMIEELKPCKVFVYGKDDGTDYKCPVEFIPHFTQKFRGDGK